MKKKFLLLVLLISLFTASSCTELFEDVDSSMWKLVWSDDFSGKELDLTKWDYDIGNCIVDANGNKVADGWGNNEKEYYTNSKNNVYLENGKLKIVARKENIVDQFGTTLNYTSGKIKTKGKFSKKYGRIEVRARLPLGKGLWPAIWMLPEKDVYGGWAASGEIDIMEAWGSDAKRVAGTLHYGASWPNNTYKGKEYIFPEGKNINQFHTYAIEWEPGEIRWYVDGVLYQTQNNWYTKGINNEEKFSFPAPFDQEFYMILNLAVGGNWDGEPDGNTQFPSTMEVDYVRVYELVGRPYKTVDAEPKVDSDAIPTDVKATTSDGNYIYNGDFSNGDVQENGDGSKSFGTGWNFVHVPDFGGNGSVEIDTINGTNFAKVNITSGGSQDYAVQLIQNVSVVKGRWYKLSFDAKTDSSRDINVKIGGGPERGWAPYSDTFKVGLTNQVQHFEKIFQMEKDTDVNARLEFELGLSTRPVWIGNVRFEEIEAPKLDTDATKKPLSDGNRVYNGTFDKGTVDRMTYWHFDLDGANATAKVPEDTRQMTIEITNGGQNKDSIKLLQKGIQILKDNDYKLKFKAKADADRTISVCVLSKDGSNYYMEDSEVSLTQEMKEYTISFTMDKDTDLESQLVFKLGGNNSNIYIDDVSLVQVSSAIDYSVIDCYPVKNGDFAKGLDSWSPYPNIGDGADSTITVENGEAKIAINKVGPNPWSILLNQERFRLYKDVEYVLSFDVRASVARNIEVVIDNSSYNRYLSEIVEAPAGEQMKHYEFTLKMPKDETANLKFLLGNTENKAPSQVHDIYIDNVKLEVVQKITKNGKFEEGTSYWKSWAGEGGDAAFDVEDGAAKFTINAVGNQAWSVQLSQEKLNIVNGKTYVLSFDAKSSVNRKIQAIVEQNGGDYKKYLAPQEVELTNEMKTYTIEFTMNEATDPAAHLVFALGKIGENALQPHDVYIDNVTLKIKQEEDSNNNDDNNNDNNDNTVIIKNGDFSDGINDWVHFKADWDGAYSTFDIEDGVAKVQIHYEGPQNWSTQLAQEGLKIEQGKTYVLSFEAKSSVNRKIQAIVEQNGGDYKKYLAPQEVELTNEMKTYTIEFTMNEATDPAAHLVFALGKIDGNEFPIQPQPHDVYIDNVVLVEKQ